LGACPIRGKSLAKILNSAKERVNDREEDLQEQKGEDEQQDVLKGKMGQEGRQALKGKGDLGLETGRGQERGVASVRPGGNPLQNILKMTGGLVKTTNRGSQEQLGGNDGECESEEKGGRLVLSQEEINLQHQ
jgi:hypothetical protein